MYIIVTRHKGMIEWLEQQGIKGKVISHVSDISDIAYQTVVGNLPLELASHCQSIITVSMPKLKPEQRGIDLTPEQMNEAGAHLEEYIVKKV